MPATSISGLSSRNHGRLGRMPQPQSSLGTIFACMLYLPGILLRRAPQSSLHRGRPHPLWSHSFPFLIHNVGCVIVLQDARESAAFIRPMLEMDPDKRASAQEMLDHPWLEGVGVSADEVGTCLAELPSEKSENFRQGEMCFAQALLLEWLGLSVVVFELKFSVSVGRG